MKGKLDKLKNVKDAPIAGRFFTPIPYDELRAIVVQARQRLPAPLDGRVWHVGSSSLRGMSGMLGVDLIAVAPHWPVSQQLVDHLDAAGLRTGGNSPHMGDNGVWFFFRDDFSVNMPNGETVGGVGCVLHLVRTEEQLIQFVSFREYCLDKEQDGFARYKRLKEDLAALKGQSKLGYKATKMERMTEILKDARQYWTERGLSLEAVSLDPPENETPK